MRPIFRLVLAAALVKARCRVVAAALMAAALLSAPIQASRAADSATCTAYANAAVAAANEVAALGCEYDLKHPQWSTRPEVHARWCRGVDQAAIDAETANRASQLRRCKSCAAYATDAVQQVKLMNKVPVCMKHPSDPRWSPDPAVHRKWCLQIDDQDVEAEHWARFGEQTRCTSCDYYARKAVSQFTRAKECSGKAPAGEQWSPDFGGHFNWCMNSARAGEANTEELRREIATGQLCTSATKSGLSKADSSAAIPRRVNPSRPKSETNSTRSALTPRNANPARPKSESQNTSSENTARAANPCQPGRVTNPCKNNSRVLSPGLVEGGGGFATQGPAASGTRAATPSVSRPSGAAVLR
jgi:hypothetical protein